MIPLNFSYPLQWPSNYPLTSKYEKSINRSFSRTLTIGEAITFLEEELQALEEVKDAVLSTDFEHIDKPHLIRRAGFENGAVLKFKYGKDYFHIACDRWLSVEQNIYAIHLVLRNIRNNVGYGVGDLRKALAGYAIGSGTYTPVNFTLEAWRSTLGLGPTATLEDAHAVYRRRAKAAGNDQALLVELNLAMDEAAKELKS